ncbi:hypothetical protein CMI37_20180 [Candidatus Pacearchaeota archaeon]|nr:hypothetical protein [Candidatus Pacearchaeota archaeon]
MSTLTIIALLSAAALLALGFVYTRVARRKEHRRLEALPPVHILTARHIINLWGTDVELGRRAAICLASMAGWKVEDVVYALAGRYGLEPDEIGSIWATQEKLTLDLLSGDMSDAELKEAVSHLFHS